jgi:hypothetical protein
MKHFALILATLFGGIILIPAIAMALFFFFFLPVSTPPQPTFGFTGNWRTTGVFGFQEKPLPPAADVWKDYNAWTSQTNFHGSRLYLARLGGAGRQSGFRTWVSSGDTPMGAQRYTNVEFIYTDPTNGTYVFTWSLRGEHDTAFLRFDDTFRLYQLQPYGTPDETPPKLCIVGIEGIRPEQYVGP